MRKLELYVKKYGAEAGQKLYHTLQSQAAHAGVSARLRRKLQSLTGPNAIPARSESSMPLFEEAGIVPEATTSRVDEPAMAE